VIAPPPRTLNLRNPDYPAALRVLADAPDPVHLRGVLPEGPAVAIVGARRASEAGRAVASRVARELAERGVIVVSGGALGIDAAAHRGALSGGGATVVVLPTPVDAPAPRRNLPLFEQALRRGGAWLSEQSEIPSNKSPFLRRNRLIAALADRVLIVEAHPGSGTRHTAVAAAALGRPVLAWTWPEGDPRGAVGRLLAARPVASIEAVLGEAPTGPDAALSALPRPTGPADGTLEHRVLSRLAEPLGLDALVGVCRAPVAEVMVALTRLELAGWVGRTALGTWRRIDRESARAGLRCRPTSR
jgi:DNA processing protein